MDDGVQAFMHVVNNGFPAVETMTGQQARVVFVGRRIPVGNLDDVASTRDRLIPGPDGDLGVRIYRPRGGGRSRPTVVFLSRRLRVLRPGFARRLLPADVAPHRHGRRLGGLPAQAGAPRAGSRTRLYAAFCWVMVNADELGINPGRVLLAGDSAGGNLAAVTALMCREQGVPMSVGFIS
jgi:acetyl esterase